LAYVSLALLWWLKWPEVRAHGWWYFGYASNFILCRGCEGGLGHFWSLAAEEQFYVVWPLLILWAPRHRLPAIIAVTIGLSAACRGWLVAIDQLNAAYMLLPPRLDALALGGLLAVLMEDGWSSAWLTSRLLATGFVCLLLGMRDSSVRAAIFDEWGMMAFSAAAILWVSQYPRSPVGRLLMWRPIVYLGTISYGIYIWHGLVPDFETILQQQFHASLHVPFAPGFPRLVYVTTVSILLASASWKWLEQPLNGLKRYFPYLPALPSASESKHILTIDRTEDSTTAAVVARKTA
jgi:peptidoglycan/LPS O-acetylase OafA/YrhL